MFSLICVAAVTLTACEEYPYGYGGNRYYGGGYYGGGYGYSGNRYYGNGYYGSGYGGYGYPYGSYGYPYGGYGYPTVAVAIGGNGYYGGGYGYGYGGYGLPTARNVIRNDLRYESSQRRVVRKTGEGEARLSIEGIRDELITATNETRRRMTEKYQVQF
jgi:hypothetical protein